MTAARKLIKEGCENCPKSESVWLEAVHFNHGENAKILIANAAQNLPRSVKIWLTAADLEDDVDAKRRVYWKALEFIPNSVVLWKQAVSLEKEEGAILLLKRAVKQIPENVELWLALAKLQNYEDARGTLNQARRAVPTDPLIWMTAAQLEEANGNQHNVEKIIEKSLRSLRNNNVVLSAMIEDRSSLIARSGSKTRITWRRPGPWSRALPSSATSSKWASNRKIDCERGPTTPARPSKRARLRLPEPFMCTHSRSFRVGVGHCRVMHSE